MRIGKECFDEENLRFVVVKRMQSDASLWVNVYDAALEDYENHFIFLPICSTSSWHLLKLDGSISLKGLKLLVFWLSPQVG
jgi:hypothetical protein